MKYKFTLTRTVTDIAEVEIDAKTPGEAARKLKSQVWGKRVQWAGAEDDIDVQVRNKHGLLQTVETVDMDSLTGVSIKEALED